MTASQSHDEAHVRAGAILRDRLTPAQLADVDLTDWFNVRDVMGYIWRVYAGTRPGRKGTGCDCAMCQNSYQCFPNLTDQNGQGRTMYELHRRMPLPDLALGLLLYFEDVTLSLRVHQESCKDPARTGPVTDALSLYESFGETEKATITIR